MLFCIVGRVVTLSYLSCGLWTLTSKGGSQDKLLTNINSSPVGVFSYKIKNKEK